MTDEKPRAKWPERIWLILAIATFGYAGVHFGFRRLVHILPEDGITGQVLPELDDTQHIEAQSGDLEGFNVLIITTDTTRADHIGCYGNVGVETPVIDGLARDGILFANNVTPSPSTLPAHTSLLTGLYPVHHGARANGTFRVRPNVQTLAERLKEKGYRTGAVISAFVLDSQFGLHQGFDLYHDDLTKGMKHAPQMFRERAAELTNEPATAWLRENADQPFFLWVHYFDPHAAYLPPEPFRSRYSHDLYDGEIAYVDSQIGVLLEELRELGVRDRTLVIYTSDHGEGLGEHGEQTHSMLVYDATLHVPLVISAPSRLPQGKVVRRQTCLVDVAPTVLSLLGEPVPAELDGIDLCQPRSPEPRPVLIETIATMTLHGWAPLLGVRRDDYKYVLAPTPELFDLNGDPKELTNVHDDQVGMVEELSQKLASWLGEDPFLATRNAVDLSSLQVDSETMRKLAALGYVASASDSAQQAAELPNPMEMITHWETIQSAVHLRVQGKPREAIEILEQCLAEVPGDAYVESILASAYMQMGEYDRALMHLRQLEALEPNNEQTRLSLAGLHIAKREFDLAEEKIQEALEIEPNSAQAYIARGNMAFYRQQEDEALRLYEQAIAMNPGMVGPNAYNQIGMVHLTAGRLDEARKAYRAAIQIDALNGAAHDGLANVLQLEGRLEEAIAQLQVALRFDPNQPRAIATLASLVSDQGDQDQALELCLRAMEMSPKNGVILNVLGLTYRRRDELALAEEHYFKAIEYAPRLDAPHINLAQLYTRQGKTDEALKHFQLAIKANRRNPHPVALANVGVYLFNRGEPRKALGFYRRALRRDPDYALAHKYVASIYTLPIFDRPDLTAHHLRRSLELEPDQPEALQMRELLARAEVEVAKRETNAPLDEPPEGDSESAEEAGDSTSDQVTETVERESTDAVGIDTVSIDQ